MKTTNDYTNDVAVFSIKPKFSAKILTGIKTVELRKTWPRRLAKGSNIYIYESSPSRCLVASARIRDIIRLPIGSLWHSCAATAGIAKSDFDEYYKSCSHGIAVFLMDVRVLPNQIDLARLRQQVGFQPPQSFRYLNSNEVERVQSLSGYVLL